jgi:quinol monooxygenase YgiN
MKEELRMIVVNARIKCKPEKRAEFLETIHRCMALSRQEAGNLSYRFYEETQKENEFIFVEE